MQDEAAGFAWLRVKLSAFELSHVTLFQADF